MDKETQPDPRFAEFQEKLDEDGKAIGFIVPNCEFLFKYDSNGGWYDEKEQYYNTNGILQSDRKLENYDDAENEDDEDDLSDMDDQLVD